MGICIHASTALVTYAYAQEQWALFPPDLEHSVRVGRFLQDVLMNVPMLDDLAVLELENINDSDAACATHSDGAYVQDHVVAHQRTPFLSGCVRWGIFRAGTGCILSAPRAHQQRSGYAGYTPDRGISRQPQNPSG